MPVGAPFLSFSCNTMPAPTSSLVAAARLEYLKKTADRDVSLGNWRKAAEGYRAADRLAAGLPRSALADLTSSSSSASSPPFRAAVASNLSLCLLHLGDATGALVAARAAADAAPQWWRPPARAAAALSAGATPSPVARRPEWGPPERAAAAAAASVALADAADDANGRATSLTLLRRVRKRCGWGSEFWGLGVIAGGHVPCRRCPAVVPALRPHNHHSTSPALRRYAGLAGSPGGAAAAALAWLAGFPGEEGRRESADADSSAAEAVAALRALWDGDDGAEDPCKGTAAESIDDYPACVSVSGPVGRAGLARALSLLPPAALGARLADRLAARAMGIAAPLSNDRTDPAVATAVAAALGWRPRLDRAAALLGAAALWGAFELEGEIVGGGDGNYPRDGHPDRAADEDEIDVTEVEAEAAATDRRSLGAVAAEAAAAEAEAVARAIEGGAGWRFDSAGPGTLARLDPPALAAVTAAEGWAIAGRAAAAAAVPTLPGGDGIPNAVPGPGRRAVSALARLERAKRLLVAALQEETATSPPEGGHRNRGVLAAVGFSAALAGDVAVDAAWLQKSVDRWLREAGTRLSPWGVAAARIEAGTLAPTAGGEGVGKGTCLRFGKADGDAAVAAVPESPTAANKSRTPSVVLALLRFVPPPPGSAGATVPPPPLSALNGPARRSLAAGVATAVANSTSPRCDGHASRAHVAGVRRATPRRPGRPGCVEVLVRATTTADPVAAAAAVRRAIAGAARASGPATTESGAVEFTASAAMAISALGHLDPEGSRVWAASPPSEGTGANGDGWEEWQTIYAGTDAGVSAGEGHGVCAFRVTDPAVTAVPSSLQPTANKTASAACGRGGATAALGRRAAASPEPCCRCPPRNAAPPEGAAESATTAADRALLSLSLPDNATSSVALATPPASAPSLARALSAKSPGNPTLLGPHYALVTRSGRPAPAPSAAMLGGAMGLVRLCTDPSDSAVAQVAQVWVEPRPGATSGGNSSGGTCGPVRWRQTAAWIVCRCPGLPRGTQGRNIEVTFGPRRVTARLRGSGDRSDGPPIPILDGETERAIRPAACWWDIQSDSDEESIDSDGRSHGSVLEVWLRKLNPEALASVVPSSGVGDSSSGAGGGDIHGDVDATTASVDPLVTWWPRLLHSHHPDDHPPAPHRRPAHATPPLPPGIGRGSVPPGLWGGVAAVADLTDLHEALPRAAAARSRLEAARTIDHATDRGLGRCRRRLEALDRARLGQRVERLQHLGQLPRAGGRGREDRRVEGVTKTSEDWAKGYGLDMADAGEQ